jgi:3-hydroxybutyryl-CoA dehydrogenase
MFTRIGVIGAGQMGAGIAQVIATAGFSTILFDAQTAALSRGMEGIHKRLDQAVEKGKLEAIIENFEIKASLFKELDSIVKPDGLLVSNTSSISITRIAASTTRPEKVMGVHFMNPVPVMKLVELIKGLQTSAETYDAIVSFCEKIQKTTVLGIDTPGFIVNRILCPMINEAIFLVQEGVRPEDIDNAMKLGTNHPMGPLTLADFVGLDTLLYILQLLHRELGEDKYRPCPLLTKYVEAGWFGKKTGRGFYSYS